MLSKEEVLHIAKLARINLSQKEIEKMQKDLSLILDYVAKINTLKLEKVEPTSHTIEIRNQFREDVAKEQGKETVQKIIEAAPLKEKGFIKIKSVFERG